jgi:hypothetical protein
MKYLMLIGLAFGRLAEAQVAPLDFTAVDARCGCSISFALETAVGQKRDSGGPFGDTQQVARSPRGGLYVLKPGHLDRVFEYSPSGEFVRTLLPGARPSANIGVMQVDSNDSLFVFDNGASDFSVLSPTRSLARREPISGKLHAALRFADGDWVFSAHVRTPEKIGIPFHVTHQGLPRASFGSLSGDFRPDRPMEGRHRIALASGRSFWATPATSLALARWSADGELVDSLTFQPSWFATWDAEERWSESVAPRSMVDAIRTDDRGRVWILASVAAASWREKLQIMRRYDEEVWSPRGWDGFLQSRIIVIDPASRRILFDAELPFYLRQFIGSTRVLRLSGAPGDGVLSVYRVTTSGSLAR